MFIKSRKKKTEIPFMQPYSCRKRGMVYFSCEEKNSCRCKDAFSCYFINSSKQDNAGFSVVLFYIYIYKITKIVRTL